MLATYAASRHRQIVPCCMISSVSHDNVSRLVTDRSMCFATALDKAFENIDCMSAILRCQAKNRFYESTQRLIQPRRVLWPRRIDLQIGEARLAVVHGGMEKINQFIFASTSAKTKAFQFDHAEVDGVIGGHCGLPSSQSVAGRLWHNSGAGGM